MKSSLFASCAAIALAASCGSVAAGTVPGKFDIKIGGDASFTALYVDQNTDGVNGIKNNQDFTNQLRLVITPSATADNGMQYGASMRARAWSGLGFIDADRAYTFVAANFGRIEGGLNAGPNNLYGVTAPNAFGTGGVMGDWAEGSGTTTVLNNQTTFLEPLFGNGYNKITNSNSATRISYFTPRFFTGSDEYTGLMGYASYVPQNLSVGTDVNRNRSLAAAADNDFCKQQGTAPVLGCNYKNITEVGFRYDGSFNGFGVVAGAAFEHGDASASAATNPNGFNDLEAFQFGVQLSYAGVTIGSSYLNAGKSAYSRNPALRLEDQSVITAGITYDIGPVVVGFNYAHGEDAGDPTVVGRRRADLYSVGATYTVAPGLTTSLEYLKSNTTNETGFATDALGNNASGTLTGFGSGDADVILWKSMVTF